jgi:hypothetical protein
VCSPKIHATVDHQAERGHRWCLCHLPHKLVVQGNPVLQPTVRVMVCTFRFSSWRFDEPIPPAPFYYSNSVTLSLCTQKNQSDILD